MASTDEATQLDWSTESFLAGPSGRLFEQEGIVGGDNKLALVFPGQGSQSVGMGRDLYEASEAARRTFDEADDALGFPISRLCFEGPDEKLRDTAFSQPAIVTMSIAVLSALEERLAAQGRTLTPAFVAGHSVGQYTALVAAGAIGFPEAIRIVRQRGQLMKKAGECYPGGMAAVLGLDETTIEDICRQARSKGMVCAANYNMPGQTVISGNPAGLAAGTALALARGARKVMPLAVTVANHSPLMASAAGEFATVLDRMPLRDARVPLVANGNGRPVTETAEVLAELRGHMVSPVRWSESVNFMLSAGVIAFWELGPGQVLAGLIKRSAKEVAAVSIGNHAAVIAITA